MNFNFIASDDFDINNFRDIDKFVDNYPDFQTVILNTEDELELLLDLIGSNDCASIELTNSEFLKYWDLSSIKFPEFDEDQFNQFYDDWIIKSQRENTMDEFGNLIFLIGLSSKWNKHKYRLIVRER